MKNFFRKILFVFILFLALFFSRKIISLYKLKKNYLINYLKKISFLFKLKFLSPLLVYNCSKFVMNKIYKEQSCLLINSLAFIILKKFYSQNINLFFGINKNEDNLNGHCWLNIYDFNITDEDKSKYEFIFKI